MDPQTLVQLLSLMEEQIKVMSDLIALSRKKSETLVDANITQLDVLLRGEQALIWQMGRLEERRFQLQVAFSTQMGIDPKQLTLERMLKVVPPEYAERCQKIAEEYGRTAKELSQINQLNSELIQQAMAYVDFSLQLLGASGPSGGKVYSPAGPRKASANQGVRRLDNRV